MKLSKALDIYLVSQLYNEPRNRQQSQFGRAGIFFTWNYKYLSLREVINLIEKDQFGISKDDHNMIRFLWYPPNAQKHSPYKSYPYETIYKSISYEII